MENNLFYLIGILILILLSINMYRIKVALNKKGEDVSMFANYGQDTKLLCNVIRSESDPAEVKRFKTLLIQHKLSLPFGIIGIIMILTGLL
jgi:hypothetical protein